jgi:hypothetical protein
LREVGELLRRASIKQILSFMCKKLLGGVMLRHSCLVYFILNVKKVLG